MVITQKISIDLPVSYVAIIDHDIVDERKAKNRTAFIKRAIEHEFKAMRIDIKPREYPGTFEEWGVGIDYKGRNKSASSLTR